VLNVFVSFNGKDKRLIDGLQRTTKAITGIKLYRFDHHTTPGKALAQKVEKAIKQADIVIVLFTRRAGVSDWVHQEIGIATGLGKPIIPIVQKGVAVRGVLEGREYIEMNPRNPVAALTKASKVLRNELRHREADIARREAERRRSQGIALVAGILLLLAAAK